MNGSDGRGRNCFYHANPKGCEGTDVCEDSRTDATEIVISHAEEMDHGQTWLTKQKRVEKGRQRREKL